MAYIVKIGNDYLTADGGQSSAQKDAARFDSRENAQAQVDVMRVRAVKPRPQGAHLGAAETAGDGGQVDGI